MDTMTHQPPLRGAVLFSVGLGRGAVTAETLAEMAQVALDRARAFASILVARGALAETKQGFVAGPAWEEWSRKPSRARPHRTSDRGVIAEMDAMRRSIAVRVRSELAARGWSLRELSRRSGVHHQYVVALTRYATPPPACQLVIIARTLGRSVEDLVAPVSASGAQMR